MTDNKEENMRFLIMSGRSGSGKSTALQLLEDEGYTCIDNMPVTLVPALIDQIRSDSQRAQQKFAIGIDARNIDGDLRQLPKVLLETTLERHEYRIIYLDAKKSVLLKRFSETRRRHPLSDDNTSLREAIEREQEVLAPMAELADITLDTSHLTLHQLRSTVKRVMLGGQSQGTAIMFTSFGFKYGVPIDSDFVFDVRSLPNPHWEPSLRTLTGQQQPVIDFLDNQEPVKEMFDDICAFITKWIPSFEQNNRSYLTISIGCTGGMHRSVYLCDKLAKELKPVFGNVQSSHRQLSSSTSGTN